MNEPLPAGRLELWDADGKLVGYFVPAGQLADLQDENATLRRQLDAVLPTATPEQQAEWDAVLAQSEPVDLAAVIEDLRANGGTDGRR